MIDVVVFDFDGVLVDSVDVKTAAFESMYAEYGSEVVAAVRAHHLAHGGVSRHRKLEHYERALLGRSPTPEQIDALAADFSARVVDGVVDAAEMPGASQLLDALRGTVALFVASGTPQDELREIVVRRGWDGVFDGVYGSPSTKAEILDDITRRARTSAERVLMVGDSITDRDGAEAAGVAFVGLADGTSFPPGTHVVGDLDELRRFVAARVART